jgi:membrane-associated phospholipid phosphatase
VDTVHVGGEASVWTDNRFTNEFAAMPSLHFGYAFLIGLTVATIPLDSCVSSSSTAQHPQLDTSQSPTTLPKSNRRLLSIILGLFYPSLILISIIATGNHFILDAVAGSIVCGIARLGNNVLLNLLVIEDWFLWLVRVHKPERTVVEPDD